MLVAGTFIGIKPDETCPFQLITLLREHVVKSVIIEFKAKYERNHVSKHIKLYIKV